MRQNLSILLLPVLLSSTTLAAAQDENRWLLAAQLGQTSLELALDDTDHARDLSGNQTSWGIGVGGHFSRHLRLEAWYQEYGEFDGVGSACPPDAPDCPAVEVRTEGDVESISLRLIPRWPIAQRLAAYAIIGYSHWDVGLRSQVFNVPVSESTSDNGVVYGAGIELRATGNLWLQIHYEQSDLEHDGTWLTMSWRF